MSNHGIAEAARVRRVTMGKIRDSLQVVKEPPESDKGGTVIGKYGKAYPSKKGSNGQGRCQGNRVASFLLVRQFPLEEFEKMDGLSESS